MMRNIFIVILCFTLLFVAFHADTYLSPNENGEFATVSFEEIFGFGLELTVGTFQVLTSIFKGPTVFYNRFTQWRKVVFGDFTLIDFIDNFTDRFPALRITKDFVESVLSPLQDVFEDLSEWIREKLVKE